MPSNHFTPARTLIFDSARPFAVRTARAVARDLGTRFVVRAYAHDPATDVVVAEGQVAVTGGRVGGLAGGKHGTDSVVPDGVVLERGQRARVDGDGRLALTRDVSLDHYFAWTEGRLVFRDTPLRDVVLQMSRWYDVDVRLASGAVGSLPVTATFDNQPVDEALRRLALALGLELSRADHTFTLVAK